MIILASQSPRRKKLLRQLNISFSIQPSSCDESYDTNEEPEAIVQMLAKRKAVDVAPGHKQALVIGADTLVVLDGQILGKPASEPEAASMLRKLRNKAHNVLTGVCLVKTDNKGNIIDNRTFAKQTVVWFGNIDEAEINRYVAGGSPMDKAGAYGIQDDWGSIFVERIEGDYNNVIGLPLYALYQQLKSFAPEFLQQPDLT